MSVGAGIIGVSHERGWARESHVPAIEAVPGIELRAVAGRDRDRAQAAADMVGPGVHAAVGVVELVADPAVDVVVVAVPVPDHEGVIQAALAAGKHVVSEWPLTPDAAGTAALGALAEESGLHAVVGLQARRAPAVVRAGHLLREGVLGRVLSVSVLSTTAGFGAVVGSHDTYLEDPAAGMNLLTIQGAHTLDLLGHLVGGWSSLCAVLSTLHPHPLLEDSTDRVARTVPDHVLVQGLLSGVGQLEAVPATVEVAGGRPAEDSPFRLHVVGELGTLVLTGGSARGFQAGDLALSVDGDPVDLEQSEWQRGLRGSAANVAGVYAALVQDLASGSHLAPSFAEAVALSSLVSAVRRSGETGDRVTLLP